MSFFDDAVGGEVVPLVVLEDGTYRADPDAVSFLSSLPASDLVVCVVAGKFRTGKSFLLNLLSGTEPGSGFGVGDTVRACTKGVWMCKRLFTVPDADSPTGKRTLLFLDTEGIASLDADDDHDVRILTLALLLSSVFVYNSIGPIDEAALQTLSLLTRVGALVGGEAGTRTASLPELFPHFVWVLRDMALRIEGPSGETLSASEYLEQSLADPAGGGGGSRASVREAVRDFFPHRTAFAFPRPVSEEAQMPLLARRGKAGLSARFGAQLDALRARIADHAPPLLVRGTRVTPRMFAALVDKVSSSMNDG